MDKEVNLQLLESYLAEEISAEQVLDMEGNALTKGELLLAVEEYQDVLIHMEGAAFKEELKEMQSSLVVDIEPVKSRKTWYAAAATILLMITAGFLWQSMSSQPGFDDYFEHFPQLETFRDGDSTNYASGMESYTKEIYEEAFVQLNGLNGLPDEIRFYQGVSAVGSSKFEQAIQVFEQLGTTSSNKYYQQTRWYLGLAYWQLGQLEQARNQLDAISSGEFKFAESRDLIKQLFD